jgi:hypothetical protein
MDYTPLAAGLIAAAVLTITAVSARAHVARHWRAVLPRLPLPTLALAASYGVYAFSRLFVPEWVAVTQAAAFELTYIGLAAATDLGAASRRRAAMVSVAAVVVSIIYNTLAGLFHRNPDWLDTLDPWHEWGLAVLHGAPLAWVAYVVAQLLLHAEPARVSNGTRGRRRLVRGLVAALRESRASAAASVKVAAQAQAEAARQAEQLAQHLTIDAQLEGESARRVRELEAQLRDAERWRAEAAQLREEAARAGELDARALAQWCASLGADGREIARRLGRPESTVRGWLKGRAVSAAD